MKRLEILRQPIVGVLLLWLAGLGAAAQFAKIAVPFPAFADAYPEAGNDVGWLLSVISLVGAVFGIVAGRVVGEVGAKQVLLVGLGLGAVLSGVQSTLPPFEIMLASRVLEGASHLAIVVSAPTLIASITTPKYSGAAMTLWGTFFGVSFALVAWVIMPFIGFDAIETLFRWHGLYLFFAGIAVLVMVPQSGPSASGSRLSLPMLLGSHADAFRSVCISGPGWGWLLYTLTFVSLIALLPSYLPTDQATLASGLMPLISIASSMLLVPLLLRRMAAVSVVAIGFAAAALFVGVGTAAGLQLSLAVGLFAIIGLVQGASFAAVPELNQTAADRALSYGCMAQTGNVGNLLGTPLFLAVGAARGEAAFYALLVLVYALGALSQVWVGFVHRRQRHGAS